jgi:hypothetical protein
MAIAPSRYPKFLPRRLLGRRRAALGRAYLNQIDGASGEADPYVRSGPTPTIDCYDCRPHQNGSNETCTFSAPIADRQDNRIRAYSMFSGVTVNTRFTP